MDSERTICVIRLPRRPPPAIAPRKNHPFRSPMTRWNHFPVTRATPVETITTVHHCSERSRAETMLRVRMDRHFVPTARNIFPTMHSTIPETGWSLLRVTRAMLVERTKGPRYSEKSRVERTQGARMGRRLAVRSTMKHSTIPETRWNLLRVTTARLVERTKDRHYFERSHVERTQRATVRGMVRRISPMHHLYCSTVLVGTGWSLLPKTEGMLVERTKGLHCCETTLAERKQRARTGPLVPSRIHSSSCRLQSRVRSCR